METENGTLDKSLASATSELAKHLDEMAPEKSGAYSEKETNELIEFWNEGAPVREIALMMNRPYNNVRNKVAQLRKKGVIRSRDVKNKLPDNYAEVMAAAYSLPTEVVEYLISLIDGNTDTILAVTPDLCRSYAEQGGYCYYLRDRIKLTMDNTPSGMQISYIDFNVVLTCRAVSSMRMMMGHNSFVNICKYIANRF